MGIKLSLSTTLDEANTEKTIIDLSNLPYIAFLKKLSLSNNATSLAKVQVKFYNGDSAKVVLTIKVAAGESILVPEENLPSEAAPTKITLVSDQVPVEVEVSVELE